MGTKLLLIHLQITVIPKGPDLTLQLRSLRIPDTSREWGRAAESAVGAADKERTPGDGQQASVTELGEGVEDLGRPPATTSVVVVGVVAHLMDIAVSSVSSVASIVVDAIAVGIAIVVRGLGGEGHKREGSENLKNSRLL